MKRYVITAFVVVLFFVIVSCVSVPLRTAKKLVVEICTDVRGYRDYDVAKELRPGEEFFVYFEPVMTYKGNVVDVRAVMSIIYPDGSKLDGIIMDGQYRVLDRNNLYIPVPLIVPIDTPLGIYTVTITMIDNYTGKTITGESKLKVVGLQV